MFKSFTYFPVIIIVFANVFAMSSEANSKFAEGLANITLNELTGGRGFRNFPKDKACFIVSLVWYDASEENGIHHQLGGILTERIIITSWAPDFSHGRESRGYCVLGFNLTRGNVVIPWRTAVSADKRPVIMKNKSDGKNYFKIALIKLEKRIDLGAKIGDYTFTKLPDVNSNLQNTFTNFSAVVNKESLKKLDTYLFYLADNQLNYTVMSALGDAGYNRLGNGPTGIAAFWKFVFMFRYGDLPPTSPGYKPKSPSRCPYESEAEGSPIIYNNQFHGIYFQQHFYNYCGWYGDGTFEILFASKVNYYAKWINQVKGLLEKDMGKARYSRLTPFVMFYGDEGKNELLGVMTFLGDNFVITDHLDANKTEKLKVLPGIRKLDANRIEWSKGIEIKDISNYPKETQLAIVELKSPVNHKRQYKINLPTTLFPVYGSHCEVMMIFDKNTHIDHPKNFQFQSETKILHEVPLLLWDYRQCKKYVTGLSKDQFCIRLDGDIRDRNHCAITPGSPVICNGQVTGIVNQPEARCQPQKPRICTNVFQLLDWVLEKMHDEPLSKRIVMNIEDIKEQMKVKKQKKKKKKKEKGTKKKDGGNGHCHPATFITSLSIIYFLYNHRFFIR